MSFSEGERSRSPGSGSASPGNKEDIHNFIEASSLKNRLRAETVQKDSLSAELARLRRQLEEVEARELQAASQFRRQIDVLESQLDTSQRELEKEHEELSKTQEQQTEMKQLLEYERQKSEELSRENQKLLHESQEQKMENNELEEYEQKIHSLEEQTRALTKALEDQEKKTEFAREAQREAARNAQATESELQAATKKLETELKAKEILVNECTTLRNDLKDARRELRESEQQSSPPSVPRLSLNSFHAEEARLQDDNYSARNRADSRTYVHFNRHHTDDIETPRPGYEEEMRTLPPSGAEGEGGHRRSNSLDSLASNSVPLTEAPDGKRGTGEGDNRGKTDEKKKEGGCPCGIM